MYNTQIGPNKMPIRLSLRSYAQITHGPLGQTSPGLKSLPRSLAPSRPLLLLRRYQTSCLYAISRSFDLSLAKTSKPSFVCVMEEEVQNLSSHPSPNPLPLLFLLLPTSQTSSSSRPSRKFSPLHAPDPSNPSQSPSPNPSSSKSSAEVPSLRQPRSSFSTGPLSDPTTNTRRALTPSSSSPSPAPAASPTSPLSSAS